MTLDPDDINAIVTALVPPLAAEIIRQQQDRQEIRLDMQYIASLPPEKRKAKLKEWRNRS